MKNYFFMDVVNRDKLTADWLEQFMRLASVHFRRDVPCVAIRKPPAGDDLFHAYVDTDMLSADDRIYKR